MSLALEQRRKPRWSERRFGLQIALVQALCHCQLPRGSSVDFFIEDQKYACQLGERPNINVLSTSLGRSKRKQIIYHTRGGGTLWKSTQTHAPQISPRGASVAPWMSNACGNPIVKDLSEAELLGYGEAFSWRIGSFIASAGNHHRDICLSLCLNESGPWTRHLRLRIAHLRSVLQREESLWKASHVKGTRLVADGLTKLMVGQAFSAFAQLLHVPGGSSQEICLIQR